MCRTRRAICHRDSARSTGIAPLRPDKRPPPGRQKVHGHYRALPAEGSFLNALPPKSATPRKRATKCRPPRRSHCLCDNERKRTVDRISQIFIISGGEMLDHRPRRPSRSRDLWPVIKKKKHTSRWKQCHTSRCTTRTLLGLKSTVAPGSDGDGNIRLRMVFVRFISRRATVYLSRCWDAQRSATELFSFNFTTSPRKRRETLGRSGTKTIVY